MVASDLISVTFDTSLAIVESTGICDVFFILLGIVPGTPCVIATFVLFAAPVGILTLFLGTGIFFLSAVPTGLSGTAATLAAPAAPAAPPANAATAAPGLSVELSGVFILLGSTGFTSFSKFSDSPPGFAGVLAAGVGAFAGVGVSFLLPSE